MRAAAVAFTFADVAAALRVLTHVRALNASVPVIVRARDEADLERLTAAGATEVVPEAFESGVMLASHTLVLAGVPLARVMRRVAQVRDQQYGLLRGLFHGRTEESPADTRTRLHAVALDARARGIGRRVDELRLADLGVEVRAVRRLGEKHKLDPKSAGELREGDVLVLLGPPEAIDAAESLLLRGRS
jgi:CPA2 family monovalent cation:H+ antiporter-2